MSEPRSVGHVIFDVYRPFLERCVALLDRLIKKVEKS